MTQFTNACSLQFYCQRISWITHFKTMWMLNVIIQHPFYSALDIQGNRTFCHPERHSGQSVSDISFDSLLPGRCGGNFTRVIFKQIWWINILSTCCETESMWVPKNPIDYKSTLVQVMVCCHQASSYYQSQCWPRSISPYGVKWLQWILTYDWENSYRNIILPIKMNSLCGVALEHSIQSSLPKWRRLNI